MGVSSLSYYKFFDKMSTLGVCAFLIFKSPLGGGNMTNERPPSWSEREKKDFRDAGILKRTWIVAVNFGAGIIDDSMRAVTTEKRLNRRYRYAEPPTFVSTFPGRCTVTVSLRGYLDGPLNG